MNDNLIYILFILGLSLVDIYLGIRCMQMKKELDYYKAMEESQYE